MSTYETTADPIMIENIRAGDVDEYSHGGRWFFNPETVRPAQESTVEPGKSELDSYLDASDRVWLKNPNGRLQYFGWAWLLNIADRALTAAFDHPAASSGTGWVLVMLLVLGVYVFNFIIVRKREIDLTRAFRMTWC